MKYIFFCFIALTFSYIHAQCDCTNCDLSIPTFGSTESEITITGATNPTLGQNGQDLRAVSINMVHDAIDELTISLVAPDGSTIMLTQETGFSSSQNMTFDICFLACGETAEPDPGFPAIFDSSSPYQSNQTYTGSYYPADNPMCFEDLTGPVDGIWRLEINDGVPLDGGTLFDWSLDFYDNDGTSCISTPCGSSCLANGGNINGTATDTLCQGDPALDYNLPPSYGTPEPDPNLYDYTYVIYDNITGEIYAFDPDADLTSFGPGEYVVCGLSFLIADAPLIPNPNGTYDITALEQDIQNNVFCADLSESGDCQLVVIEELPPSPMISGPDTICENDTAIFIIDDYDPNSTYNVFLNQGSVSSIVIINEQIEIGIGSGPIEFCVERINSCGPSGQTCVLVEVVSNPNPITIDGPDTICPGITYTYTITPPLEPGESYDIQIIGGTIISLTDNILRVEWSQNTINQIIANIIGSDCQIPEGTLNVSLDEYTFPQSFNSPVSACVGDTLTSFIIPDPDIINYTWTATNADIISATDLNEVQFIPLSSGTVEICLEVETDCGVFGPECESIQINALPEPSIDPVGAVCALNFPLSAQVPGGFDDLSWSTIGGPGTLTFNPINSLNTVGTVSESGTYTVVLTAENAGCVGYDTIQVEIADFPDTSNFEIVCDTNRMFTVSFDILGGTAPYQVNGSALTGNSFTSMSFPSGTSYSFSITDDNNCEFILEETFDCPCISNAGIMASDRIEICVTSDSISFELIQNPNLDADDTVGYVLHTGATNNISGFVGYFNSRNIILPDTLLTNTIYYFSQVVGNNLNGQVDLNDSCLSVSAGQPFILIPLPDFSIEDSTLACGLNAITTIQNSVNPGFVQILSDTSGTELSFSLSNGAISWQADRPITITFSYTESNDFCVRTDTFMLQLLGNPQVLNFETFCFVDSFTFSFDVPAAGAPYTINGIPFTGTSYISDTISTDSMFTVIIEDRNGCSSRPIMVDVDCSCINESGFLNNSILELCVGEDIDRQNLIWRDSTLESSDTSLILLYDGPNPASANLLAQDTSGVIPFNNYILLDTFYVFVATGDTLNGNLDFNDLCLDFSNPVPVIWLPLNEIELSGTYNACIGDTISIPMSAQGAFPYSISLSSTHGRSESIIVDSSTLNLDLIVEFENETWNIQSISGACTSINASSFEVNGQNPLEVSFLEADTICNDPAFNSTLDLNSLLVSNPQGTWSSDDVPINGSIADFAGISEGTYTFTFSTIGFEDPCPGNNFTVEIPVIECECPQVSLPANLEFCTIEESFDLSQLGVTIQGTWTIVNLNSLSSPPNILGTQLEFNDASPGTYQLLFTLTDSLPVNCMTEFTSTLNIFDLRSSGEQTQLPVICGVQDTILDLNTVLSGASPQGIWTYDGQTIDALVNISEYEEGQQVFTYTTPSNGRCPSNQTDVIIEIIGDIDYSLTLTDASCFNLSNGAIEVISEEEDFDLWNFSLNGQSMTNPAIGLDAGEYVLVIENSASCAFREEFTISQPSELSVDLGPDQNVRRNAVVPIDASLSIDSNALGSINWLINGSPISANDLSFDYIIERNTLFEVFIEDTNGCAANAQKRVNIIEDPIYIPNVFRPNSDIRDNARFGIEGDPNTLIKSFRIFDRWGNMMFEVENVTAGTEESYWDGRSGQKRAHTGVYVYSIEIELPNGNIRYIKGDVTLLP